LGNFLQLLLDIGFAKQSSHGLSPPLLQIGDKLGICGSRDGSSSFPFEKAFQEKSSTIAQDYPTLYTIA
jgi:hypothetical protein